MKTKNQAFTLTELLVVIAIIALLVGIAVPSLMGARKSAKKMREKNNITNMSTAIESFKNDHGFYPESGLRSPGDPRFQVLLPMQQQNNIQPVDQGAHRIVESLVGLDFRGYQEEHYYELAKNNPDFPDGTPIFPNPFPPPDNKITKRWEYLEIDNYKFATMQEAHKYGVNFANGNDNYVFVDQLELNEFRAILYYRARSSGTTIGNIYNYDDNRSITLDLDNRPDVPERPSEFIHYLDKKTPSFDVDDYYEYILNPKTATPQNTGLPFKKDSFLLIGAGWDHIYGTEDDITNFNK